MKVITLAASKGGGGKTSVGAALSVRAAQEAKVALVDMEPEGGGALTNWYKRRESKGNPKLWTGIDVLADDINLLRQDGWQYVFVDTPSAPINLIEPAVMLADLVLIPVRASALDAERIAPTIELCTIHQRPFAFVLNATHPKWKLTRSIETYLRDHAGRVLETQIEERQEHVACMTVGKTGPEIGKDGKAKKEIDALWGEIRRLVNPKQKGGGRG